MVVSAVNAFMLVKKSKLSFLHDIQELKLQEPSSNSSDRKASYSVIVEKNIFGPLGTKKVSVVAPVKPQTKLPLALIGTFLQPGDTPYAIIEDDKKKVQDVFNIGDTIFGDAKLIEIFSDKVKINRAGAMEFLTIDDAPDASSGTTTAAGDNDVVVDQQELETALQNLPLLLTQARAVPYFKDGKAVGLRMFSIKAGSMYEKIGLQNGDILKSINGNSLSDISQAMRLFELLKEERSISVSLERNREEKNMHYQIR